MAIDEVMRKVAEKFKDLTKFMIHESNVDLGMFIFQKGEGIGLSIGGREDHIDNERFMKFLKTASERIHNMIEANANGGLDLAHGDPNLIFDSHKKFISFDEFEKQEKEEKGGEKGFAA